MSTLYLYKTFCKSIYDVFKKALLFQESPSILDNGEDFQMREHLYNRPEPLLSHFFGSPSLPLQLQDGARVGKSFGIWW